MELETRLDTMGSLFTELMSSVNYFSYPVKKIFEFYGKSSAEWKGAIINQLRLNGKDL
ncbi:MAG: hypothetical protein Q4D73_02845 [Actinomycetaceae bacterium]|nr:hypothetical protein [Actinomycetaceae bacterium]